MKNLIVGFFLFITYFSHSQNRYVNWFFAYGAGLKFSASGPLVVNGGKTATEEGVASISDVCGNLLFYSDGTKIWNKKHNLMVNGNGLNGHIQSAEAVLIVPKPLSDSLYYVFTSYSYGGNQGIHYNIVDMSKQSGDGEVVVKNVKLYGNASEKLCAVFHQNKKDYWILTHDWNNSEYKVFLLTDLGLNTTPVVSKLGPSTGSNIENALGHLRPSQDGKKIACTFWYQNQLDIYNFNLTTGTLSTLSTLTNFDHNRPYSIEFSPDGKTLYVGEAATSSNNDIYQFDMTASNIAGSRYKITTANYRFGNFGLAPDGKFYVAQFNQNYLGVISNPNTFGSGVNYTQNGFSLGSQTSKLGLPNPIFPIVLQNSEYTMSVLPGCKLSDPVLFDMFSNFCYDSLLWDFSDFSSGNNYSRSKKNTHTYPYRGNYDITLIVYYNGKSDTLNQNVKVPAGPVVDLGKDTFYCAKFQHFMDAGNPGSSYLWQDNYTGKARMDTLPGTYYVKVTSSNCSTSDTLKIARYYSENLGRDTNLCFQTSYVYTQLKADSIIWENGLNSKSRTFIAPGGLYKAKIYKNKCVVNDEIQITLADLYANPLPGDTLICEGQTLEFDFKNSSLSYLWSDMDKSSKKTISKAGKYGLLQSVGTCAHKDSFNLSVIEKLQLPPVRDTTLCPGDAYDILNLIGGQNLTLNGNTITGNLVSLKKEGIYKFRAQNKCFSDSVSFEIVLDSCVGTELIFPNIFSPNGDNQNEAFSPIVIGNKDKVKQYEFSIYNRWGEQIYSTKNIDKGWNGEYASSPCQSGYYMYNCNAKLLIDNELKSLHLKGLVFIMR